MNSYDKQYIGVLADSEDINGRDSIFVNQQSCIQYMVKSLLMPCESTNVIAGFLSCLGEDSEIKDDEYIGEEERINNFYNAVKDKFFIFSYKNKESGYLAVTKANLVEKIPDLENTMFYSIPVFSCDDDETVINWENETRWKLYRDYSSWEEFKDTIIKNKSVGRIYGYDAEAFNSSFIIWKDRNGKLTAVGNIESSRYNTLGGLILDCNNIFTIDLSDYAKFVVYNENLNPTLMFIPENTYALINNRLVKASVAIQNSSNDEAMQEIESHEEIKEEKEPIETSYELLTPGYEELIEIDTSVKNDELIIKSMDYHSQKRGLYYSIKDFINIHTAIKCSNLVILSGMSGTGKSAIVDIYARSLGINGSTNPDENRLLIIPVRPSWNDDADLLGYVDLVHMVYRAADSGFVDFLVRSQKDENKGKLFLVCFDEMNLARVEHYFSQFLSILERPVAQRELQLYDKQYSGRLYNSADYPNRIKIGDNIRFIGTVNIDESTYHFSDKVLDRANVIQLDVLDYSKNWIKKNYETLGNVNWTLDEYDAITIKNADKDMEEIQSLLWDLHILLQSASSKYGVGPRIVKCIKMYLLNLMQTEQFPISDAIDLQIAQRVLTKVRGPETQLGNILDMDGDETFFTIFDKYSNLSTFSICRKIINQKKKELETYGYCI